MYNTLDFLNALYPDRFGELGLEPAPQLVVWSLDAKRRGARSDWCTDAVSATLLVERWRASRQMFYGVALQDLDAALAAARVRRPDAVPASVRGTAETARVLPAVWVDLDVAGGAHAGGDLIPDRDAARQLLADAVPLAPSALVWTGGGYHAYWFLDEPWTLDAPAERAAAAQLVARLQHAVRRRAGERGWRVDNTADMARVLRLPGSLNLKTMVPRPTEIEELTKERRFAPSAFEVLPEAPLQSPARVSAPAGEAAASAAASGPASEAAASGAAANDAADGPPAEKPADFNRVWKGCSWIRRCVDLRAELSEPHWYAALSIVGRCATAKSDGRRLAHRLSEGHPGYSPPATDAKLAQALAASGPRTCEHVAHALGAWNEDCSRCRHHGRIRSPIVLGRRRTDRSSVAPPSADPPSADPASVAPPSADPPSVDPPSDGAPPRRPPPQQSPPQQSPPQQSPPQQGPQRVRIELSHFENEVVDRALTVVGEREENLFQRGTALVQVTAANDDRPHRPAEPAAARPVGDARMRELFTTYCEFGRFQRRENGPRWQPAHPPQWVSRAALGRLAWPEVARLEGVVEGPVMRPDGTVLQRPGYDPGSGLYLSTAARFVEVPRRPTAAQVHAAVAALRDAVCDFPFAEEHHFAGWLAALLTPLARYTFRGPSPLNVFDANVRGAGKSLLVDVCHLIATGRPAPRMAYQHDEAELRKAITSLALQGRQIVLFDNVSGRFGSPTLDLALTSTTWKDRLLGMNSEVDLPLLVSWYVTGNNMECGGDLLRRSLHVRLETPELKPERRSDFRHPKLLTWLEQERSTLLPAALTLLAAYHEAGCPDQRLRAWGSYEHWSEAVRAPLVWLGLPDPLDTVAGLEASADVEQAALANLVAGLRELLADLGGSATAGEILRQLESSDRDRYPRLQNALEDLFPRLRNGELPSPAKLGHKLRTVRGRPFEAGMLEGEKSKDGVRWRVRSEE